MQRSVTKTAASVTSVAVHAADAAGRAALEDIVREAGFAIVDIDSADVVLARGDIPRSSKPVLVLDDGELADREGWLPTSASPLQIRAALTAVAAGLDVRVRREATSANFAPMAEHAAAELLTPRELEILNEIGAGRSNKAIARTLGISLHTVKFHIESLLRKLGARTRAEAVAKALERRTADRIDV